MPTKTICILANSIKFGGRCVAGMELVQNNGNLELTRNWVRPIGLRRNGELQDSESCVKDGSRNIQPAPLDIVEIPLRQPAHEAAQPENWLIDPNKKWVRKGTLDEKQLASLAQSPTSLWLENAYKPDRVTPDFVLQNRLPSLYLVPVQNFRIEIVEAPVFGSGQLKKKRRAHFQYREKRYDLALTDPVMQSKFFPAFPNVSLGHVTPGPNADCTICVSLAPKYFGYHYKLVAAVL